MKVDKNDLQNALSKVSPGLAHKELIYQSTSFAFLGDRVVTYNDEISISHPVEGLDIVGAVKAQPLYSFLERVKADEIDIALDGQQIVIKAGKAKAGFVLEQEIALPLDELGEITKWEDAPGNFIPALQLCYPCCSMDWSRPVLTCVHAKDNVMEASDSYQIIRYQLDGKVSVGEMLLPFTTAKELVKYNVTHMAKGEGWLHFSTPEGTIFSSRVPDGIFPDVDAFLDVDGPEVSFPSSSLEILSRASVFAKDEILLDMPLVTVTIASDRVKFHTRNQDGWFEEEDKVEYNAAPVEFVASVESLSNLLSKMTSCIIGSNRVKFSGDCWEHVIATAAKEEVGGRSERVL